MSSFNEQDESYMRRALELAQCAFDSGEVPVGAVVVANEQIIGEGWNCPISTQDMSAHAEVVAMRAAARALQNYRLPHATLYVTIEPCTMCVGALIHARVQRIVYGATEPKAGAVDSRLQLLNLDHWNHQVTWQGGLLAEQASELMQRFFSERRAKKKALKAGP